MMKFYKYLSGVVIGWRLNLSMERLGINLIYATINFRFIFNCFLVVPYRLRRLQQYLNCGEESKVKSLCTVFPGHSSRKRVGPYLLFEGRVRIT